MEEGTESKADGIRRFDTLVRSLAHSEDLTSAGQRCLDAIVSETSADGAYLYAIDEASGPILLLASGGPPVSAAADEVAPRVAATGNAASSQRALGIPILSSDKVVGVLALEFATKVPIEVGSTTHAYLNDTCAVLVRILNAEKARERTEDRWKRFIAASQEAFQALAVVPASQLLANLQRGFEGWPFRESDLLPEFFRSTLQSIAEQVKLVVGAEMAAIGIGRFPSEPFDPWVVAGVSDELLRTLGRNPRPVGTLGSAAVNGKRIRVRSLAEHPDFQGLPPGHPEIRSFLAIPIVHGTVNLGTLYAANKIGAEEFSVEDEVAADELGRFVAIAVQQTFFCAAFEVYQARLQIILDGVPEGMVFVDASSGDIVANAASVDLFGIGLTRKGKRDQYVRRLRSANGEPVAIDDLPSSAALQGKTVLGREMIITRPDGSTLPVRVNAAPVFGFRNHLIGVVVVFENIGPEKELELYRQEVANMLAHDLRNPLNTLKMSLQILMQDHDMNTGVAELLGPMDRSVDRLDHMIGELIEVARIEGRQMALTLERVGICAFVGGVLDRIRPAHPGRIIQFTDTKEIVVKLDKNRMDQVISNLVDNAIKYSPAESRVSVWVKEGNRGIEISVKDQGSGMSREQIDRIFDRYYRIKSGNQTGLGLGLYITKGLVEAHSATISVVSEIGKGSTFTVCLPTGSRR